MNDCRTFFYLIQSHTVIKIFIGSFFLGIASGIIGIFISFKKKSLIGDTLSHAVLPGIALSYIWFHSTSEQIIWCGAFISAFISLFLIELIKKYSRLKSDTILSLILSSFFGLGNVLIAYIQKKTEDCSIAVLEKFILGQVALISGKNVQIICLISFFIILITILFWKELKLFTFDENFAQSVGFNRLLLTSLLNTLLIVLITTSLKITGIIFTSGFLIIPGVITRYLSDKLATNMFLVSIIAFFSSILGIILSLQITNLPTGPIIIVINTFFIILTCLFAPKYGMIRKFWQRRKYQQKIKKFKQLIHFYHHCLTRNIVFAPFLFKEKYLQQEGSKIIITTKGIELVENLIQGRI
ncbi:MAG: metal ABC transporter permease [Vigna little leaf phytoplasma]|nr:metal ABC transporter permease [Vigna little leaf phytoplasma]